MQGMSYSDIISQVASSTGLPSRLVDSSYRAFWRAVREYISSLPLKKDLTEEDFVKLRPNVNIPSIGKLYVTHDRYVRMKRYFKNYYKNYKGNKYKNQDNNAKD